MNRPQSVPPTPRSLELDLVGIRNAARAARIEKRLTQLPGVVAQLNFAKEKVR